MQFRNSAAAGHFYQNESSVCVCVCAGCSLGCGVSIFTFYIFISVYFFTRIKSKYHAVALPLPARAMLNRKIPLFSAFDGFVIVFGSSYRLHVSDCLCYCSHILRALARVLMPVIWLSLWQRAKRSIPRTTLFVHFISLNRRHLSGGIVLCAILSHSNCTILLNSL